MQEIVETVSTRPQKLCFKRGKKTLPLLWDDFQVILILID